MKTSVRDQLRGREGKAKVRADLNRRFRRQARIDLREGYEPTLRATRLERVLV